MTQDEIIEGNKLIAEFMGYNSTVRKYTDNPEDKGVLVFYFPIEGTDQAYLKSADEMLYHSSWDWLMCVVEKIENGMGRKYSVDTSNNLYSNGIAYETKIYDAGNYLCIEMPQEESKILSVYYAVIEFIKTP